MLLQATAAKVTEGTINGGCDGPFDVVGISNTAKVPSALFDNLYFYSVDALCHE